MADPYTLGLTAAQIDTTLARAHNSDNAPAAGSSNLVASDKIYEADQNILTQSKSYTDIFKPNIVQGVRSVPWENANPQNNWHDIDGLDVSIIPRATGSKILIESSVHNSSDNGTYSCMFRYVRSYGTPIALGGVDGSRVRCSFSGNYGGGYGCVTSGLTYLDPISTTAGVAVKYKIQVYGHGSVSIYINRSNTDGNHNYAPRPISTLTLSEVYQ